MLGLSKDSCETERKITGRVYGPKVARPEEFSSSSPVPLATTKASACLPATRGARKRPTSCLVLRLLDLSDLWFYFSRDLLLDTTTAQQLTPSLWSLVRPLFERDVEGKAAKDDEGCCGRGDVIRLIYTIYPSSPAASAAPRTAS